VVVPTCNRPDFLARALQSILNQTYPSVEILVVNDGGIDVRELVEYHNQRGNIRYIHLPKKVERSAARNIALRAAQGEYIAYLDDDDRYYPEHLATLVECLQKTGAAVAYSDARRVHGHLENGQLVVDKHDVPFSIDYNSRRLLIENYIPILCIMHKRSLLDQAGMFDETLTRLEDWDLWIRLSQHAHFEHLAAITCEFTHHAAGSTLAAENAPAFLNSCRQIYQRYAYLVQGQPDLLKWQRKVLHHKTCYVYDYLREVLQALVVEVEDQKPMQRDELLHRLRLHGVTQAQLESALLWCMGLQSTTGAAEDYFLKALVNDEENVRAREELVQHYLRQKRYAEATQHLEALNRQNPEDEQVMGVLEKMRRC
jgi:glycosyltransferase involved in cell wall biosynthesis